MNAPSVLKESNSSERYTIKGQIKWFDPIKGYGFIVPEDESMGDVLLHITSLRDAGRVDAPQGATVICEVIYQEKGFQVDELIEFDVSTATPCHDHANTDEELVSLDLKRAKVKWFNKDRQYGFMNIGCSTVDIFLHAVTLNRIGLSETKPGDQFWIRCGRGPKGVVVADIQLEKDEKKRQGPES